MLFFVITSPFPILGHGPGPGPGTSLGTGTGPRPKLNTMAILSKTENEYASMRPSG